MVCGEYLISITASVMGGLVNISNYLNIGNESKVALANCPGEWRPLAVADGSGGEVCFGLA